MGTRTNKVTRWRTDTVYEWEKFTLSDREIHKEKRTIKGMRTPEYIRKCIQKEIKDGEMIVSIRVLEYVKRLYGMPEEQYYANAKLIREERKEKKED